MTALRTLQPKNGELFVTSHRQVEAASLRLCTQLANLHQPNDRSKLLHLYRMLGWIEGRTRRSDDEDGAAALELATRLWQLLTEFHQAPGEFRAAFRRRGAAGLVERRKRLKAVQTFAKYEVKANGELFFFYLVQFPTDEALVEFGRALLTDPRFDAQRLRRCLLESCERFFLRNGKRIYCSDECTEKADRKLVVARVRKWRENQKERARKHK